MSDGKNKLESSKVVERKVGKTSTVKVKNEAAGSSQKTESKLVRKDETRLSSDKLRKSISNADSKVSASQEVKKSRSDSIAKLKSKEQISSPYISGRFISYLRLIFLTL